MNFIEVASGAGGLSTGLMKSGWTPLLLNDIDKVCCKTLRQNHPGVPIFEGSMTGLDLTPYQGNVDLLCGGVPCQAFSLAGKRKGTDDPRGRLILDFIRLIKECQPKVFMIENVVGLLRFEQGRFFTSLLQQLTLDGTFTVNHKVLNAKDFGVPQRRERVIIVGVRNDIQKTFIFPTPLTSYVYLKDVLTNVPLSPGVQYSDKKKAMLVLIPPGGNWRSLSREKQIEFLGEAFIHNRPSAGVLKRLSMNDFCLTLTTAPDQRITERCHPLEVRPLTVREYARIQTYDDSYIFCGSVRQMYKQIGNSVPVAVAKQLGEALSKVV
jgi:DNA (cytosine-5)-methyltransferase 1